MTLTEEELDRLEGLAGAGSTEALTAIVASLREARKALARVEALLRPFAAAYYNDNGDVTLDTSHLSISDYGTAARFLRSRTHSGEPK